MKTLRSTLYKPTYRKEGRSNQPNWKRHRPAKLTKTDMLEDWYEQIDLEDQLAMEEADCQDDYHYNNYASELIEMKNMKTDDGNGNGNGNSNWFDTLPVGSIEHIRRTLDLIKSVYSDHVACDDAFEALEFFFRHALMPFYDCMWDGLKLEAGHVIYRLSDKLPDDICTTIKTYPCIDINPEQPNEWYTLSSFRQEWENLHPVIPELQHLLPPEPLPKNPQEQARMDQD